MSASPLLRRVLLACLAAMLGAAPAGAQLLPLPGQAAAPARPATPVESAVDTRARLERALAEARVGSAEAGAGLVPGLASDDNAELAQLRAAAPAQVEARLQALSDLEVARKAGEEADRALAGWSGERDAGPYTIAQFEEAADRVASLQARLFGLESVVALNVPEGDRLAAQLREREAAERRLDETAKAGDVSDGPLRLARARTEQARAALELQQLRQDLAERELATARARLDLARKRLQVVGADYRFSEADLQQIELRQQQTTVELQAELERAARARAQALAERDAARQAVERLLGARKEGEGAAVAAVAAADRRLKAAEETLEALQLTITLLSVQRDLVPAVTQLWQQRYRLNNATDPAMRREAAQTLQNLFKRLEAVQPYVRDLQRLQPLRSQQSIEQRIAAGGDAAALKADRVALEAARGAQAQLAALTTTAERLQVAQARSRDAMARAASERDGRAKFDDAVAAVRSGLDKAWNFELFAVEDTVESGGRLRAVARAVTVGKSIGAVALFVIGYWVVAALSRRLAQRAVARALITDANAKVLRRWLMLLAGMILLVVTLNLARIPLTVFAFLGGALAIGVGFGTQTLLKNLISGVMVLLERKIRVGDIVEVDGVIGTVTALDIRSTTLRQFDGIETLVPNSLLLENKVTNWTGESPLVRRTVKVGVAYGSPLRQVADLMRAAALEHGLVEKDPEPYVLFEDFGDSALVFTLFFWASLTARASVGSIQSDLRFMLDKRFAEAGIVIAFPQRDVRVDLAQPLAVHVLRDLPQAGAAAA